jgi:alpha-tubulin suppressor-like RCC1 family protein
VLTGWGSNRWNQLGSSLSNSGQPQERAKLEPALILENERFVSISAGEGHSLLVSETGDLISCGRGTEGQVN